MAIIRMGLIRAIAVMAIALPLISISACQSGPSSRDMFKEAFNKFKQGVSAGKKEEIGRYISKNFDHDEFDYGIVVEIFSGKGAGFNAMLSDSDINVISDDRIEVSYLRIERVDSKTERFRVNREIWVKEGEDGWKLSRLSSDDLLRIDAKRKLREEELGKLFASLTLGDNKKGVYFSGNARDPFESLIIEISPTAGSTRAVAVRCDPNRRREFLETFELLSIQLVGVLKVDNYIALVETPNGKGYTVKQGMHLGRHCGKVIRISQDKITLAEQYVMPKGNIKTKRTEINLKQEES